MASHQEMLTKYIELRDAKEKVIERHKDELRKYADAMLMIETYITDYLKKQGLQHLSSGDVTAFLQRTRKATVADTGVFRGFVIDNGNFDLADMRPKVDAVETYVSEHNGHPPPGVNFQTAIVLRVQRR